jgi:hypothetical protein
MVPRIEGSNFDEAFYLNQFHYHWGRSNLNGLTFYFTLTKKGVSANRPTGKKVSFKVNSRSRYVTLRRTLRQYVTETDELEAFTVLL